MRASLDQFRIAHINSDFPADYAGDVARGTSDHDPNVASFTLQFPFSGFISPVKAAPALNAAKAGQTIPVKFSLDGNRGLDIVAQAPVVTPVSCSDLAPSDAMVAATGKHRNDAGADLPQVEAASTTRARAPANAGALSFRAMTWRSRRNSQHRDDGTELRPESVVQLGFELRRVLSARVSRRYGDAGRA